MRVVIIMAAVTVLSPLTPIHPVYTLAGGLLTIGVALWKLFKLEKDGQLS